MSFTHSVVVPMVKPESVALEDFLQKIRKIGFTAVEFWGVDHDFSHTAALAARNDLRIAGFIAGVGISQLDHHAEFLQAVEANIDRAAQHGVPGVIILTGNRVQGESDLDSMRVCAEALARIAPHAEAKGVNLNVEILNSKIDHPDYLCDKVDWAIALCEMVRSPRVKILLDLYHVQIMEGDLIRNFRKAAPWLGHIHTAGNPGRSDMDDTQEINYRGIFRVLRDEGYQGFVGHEFKPRGDIYEALVQTLALDKVE